MSSLRYIPKNATAEIPAPGIAAIHGYINSHETQDGFAIEFARRGYMVLAPDQTGHGCSDPPAMASGFGSADSLHYILTPDIVDKDNIGLKGHSMGEGLARSSNVPRLLISHHCVEDDEKLTHAGHDSDFLELARIPQKSRISQSCQSS